LKSKPITVVVKGGDEIAAPQEGASKATSKSTRRAGQDRLNRKLRSILSRTDLTIANGKLTITKPWFLGVAFGVPLLYLGLIFFFRTRKKMAEDRVKNRSKRADGEALKRLATLNKGINDLSTEEFFAGLARALLGFLEDRLEEPVAGDTMSELRYRLRDRGFQGELVEKVVTELESCDFARFARDAGITDEKHQALGRVEQLIRDLARVRVTPKKRAK
jgi:hypothetical protein